jgi:proline racemase
MDIAFGGDLFFAYLPAASVGLELKPELCGDILTTGMKIWDTLSQQLRPQHPEKPELTGLTAVMFTGEATNPKATMKNALVAAPGLMDRSPCGTGTSGRMACLHARGQLALNERFVHESIIGTLFYCGLVEETRVGPYTAVVPTVTGRAWIMGIQQFVLDPEDPFPFGFLLGKKREVYGPWG